MRGRDVDKEWQNFFGNNPDTDDDIPPLEEYPYDETDEEYEERVKYIPKELRFPRPKRPQPKPQDTSEFASARGYRRVTFSDNGNHGATEEIDYGNYPAVAQEQATARLVANNDFALQNNNIKAGVTNNAINQMFGYERNKVNQSARLTETRMNHQANAQTAATQLQAQRLKHRADALESENRLRAQQMQNQHEYNMAALGQVPTIRRLDMEEEQMRFNNDLLRQAEQLRKAAEYRTQQIQQELALHQYKDAAQRQYHSILNLEQTRQGTKEIEKRKSLYTTFGFSEDAAYAPYIPRLSDTVFIPSQTAKVNNYVCSRLATGVDKVNRGNPYNAYILFNDGTKMLPTTGYDGMIHHSVRLDTGTYIINIAYVGPAKVQEIYKRHKRCCKDGCNIQ